MKYKSFCTSRSRADVLLRELADEPYLAEKSRLQGNQTSLCAQLLLPAKRIVYYNNFLQVSVCKSEKRPNQNQRSHSLTTLCITLCITSRRTRKLMVKTTPALYVHNVTIKILFIETFAGIVFRPCIRT